MNLRNVEGNGHAVIANKSVIPVFAGKKWENEGKIQKILPRPGILPA